MRLRRDPLAPARKRGLIIEQAVFACPVRVILPAAHPLPPGLAPWGGEMAVTPHYLVRVHEAGDWVWPLNELGAGSPLGSAGVFLTLSGHAVQVLLMRARDVAPLATVVRYAWEAGRPHPVTR